MDENLKRIEELKSFMGGDHEDNPIYPKALDDMKYIVEQCNIHKLPQPEIFPWSGGNGVQAEWEYDWHLEINSSSNNVSVLFVKGKDYKNAISTHLSDINNAFLLVKEFINHVIDKNGGREMAVKKPIEIDYCKEAMEMHLKELPPRDVNIIVASIAKVVNGELNDINLVLNKIDEKTGEIIKIKVPVKSFLRCDSIIKLLLSLGISGTKISNYLESLENPNSKVKLEISNKPVDLNEVKRFIYDTLKEKYGDAVISKRYAKDIVINTQTEKNGVTDVWISLEYFH